MGVYSAILGIYRNCGVIMGLALYTLTIALVIIYFNAIVFDKTKEDE